MIGTPVARIGEHVRWRAGVLHRSNHPELWDMYLEDRRTYIALAEILKPDSNCLDVGAHIGSVLAEMARLAPDGKHIAIEPSPQKAEWLRKKFQDVQVIEAATSDKEGDAVFYDDLKRPGFSGLRKPVGDTSLRNYDVKLVTLDRQLKDLKKLDFMKVDVEGAELPTFLGAKALLERHRPTILFECGLESHVQRFDYKRMDLFDCLVSYNYDIYSIVDYVYGREKMTPESFKKAGTYPYQGFNFIALPAGSPVRRLA